MKILFVVSGNSTFKIVPFIVYQAVSLRSLGVEVDIFPIVGKGFFGYAKNIPKLRSLFYLNRYDIIHSHYGLSGFFTTISLVSCKKVLSLMGTDVYPDHSKSNKIINFLKWILNYLLSTVAIIFSDIVIVKSKNIFEYLLYKSKTFIIPNGVDFSSFAPSSEELCIEKNILFLGNTKDPRKNFELAKRSFDLINDGTFNLVTPFPAKPTDIASIINSAKLLILTSLNEGSPNVVKEAMACNIPIVSTAVGDVEDLIGKTEGCFIAKFDERDFSKKILMALKFNKRTGGRNDIKHLDSRLIGQRLIDLYDLILKK